MPTSRKTKTSILTALPPFVEGTIYELGSGWGTMTLPLAEIYPYNKVIGCETSPLPYIISKWRVSSPNLCMLRQDFHLLSLTDAGLVFCYLYPGAMKQLKVKFESELPEGAWVISNTFAVPGWIAHQVIEVKDIYHTKIYIYKVRKNHPPTV